MRSMRAMRSLMSLLTGCKPLIRMSTGPIERALQGHDPGAKLVAVDDRGSGTCARMRVTLMSPSGVLPPTVFVKQPARSPVARAVATAAGLTRTEVGFYRNLRDAVPVGVPRCFHAAHGRAPGSFLLVLEDLARR